MSDPVILALIAAVASTITAISSAFFGVLNTYLTKKGLTKQDENAVKLDDTKTAMQTLEKNTNSIKDALIISTEKAAHAAGYTEARAVFEPKPDPPKKPDAPNS
jgi:hypothetical protein